MSNTPDREYLVTASGRRIALPTPEEDAAITAAAMADPDCPPMTEGDAARMRPAREVLSPALYAALASKGGRPKSATPKVFTGIRFDADVLAALKATGKGWQTRVNDAMRDWLKTRSPG
ncbi:MAG: BrnA antitoxin family protein, partial [Candidatus Accumulibacter sp.]|nr:BrnA antitoxin family protein [Accumulibacter sp.]